MTDEVTTSKALIEDIKSQEEGNIVPPKSIVEWIVENSVLPDTCPWAYQVNDGILVSASDSGKEQGVKAADLAVKVLGGVKPGNLSIITPPNGVPVINESRAKKLKINIPQQVLEEILEFGKIY